MEIEEVLQGIIRHREQIHKKDMWEHPLQLSETMTKLAVYNSYLADKMAFTHKQATDKAYQIYQECRKEDLGVTESEKMAKGESTETRLEYENIRSVYAATANLISVLQSRLRVLENEINKGQ